MPDEFHVETNSSLLEIGWIVAGKLEDIDLRAARNARDAVLAFFRETFPGTQFRMPMIHRDELVHDLREEAVVLLDYAVTQRNVKRWDYTIVVTSADLIGHYKTDALAAVSRTLESAVLSTTRIDPRASREQVDREERLSRLTHRIRELVLHSLGHLMGLDHAESPDNIMYEYSTIAELDAPKTLSPEQIAQVRREIEGTADNRLEEISHSRPTAATFYAQAAWLNRHEIVDAIVDAKPWQFPLRLSRLTAAAASAMLILLVTAEVWELSTSQSMLSVASLSALSVVFTTIYILIRQKLFVRRERSLLSEQNVVTNIATFSIVLSGILTTYWLFFTTTLLLGYVFFDANVVANWTDFKQTMPLGHYFLLSGFIASLGIFIGSLGASFEQQHYFRHITFVDEEI